MKSTGRPTVAAALALLAGCGTHPPPGLLTGDAAVPSATGVCQHTCTPDPGPPAMTENDCTAAETGFELLPISDYDFMDMGGYAARVTYSYTDNTAQISSFSTLNNQTNAYERKTWQPPVVEMARCGSVQHVLHIQGGPFLGWGGGIGMSMKDFINKADPRVQNDPSVPDSIAGAVIDASQWEGVAFWARRGPDSQAGFRVLVGDKQTDDDVAYRMYKEDPTTPRFCERVRECACLNHMDCKAIPLADVTTMKSACVFAHSPPPMMSFCGAPQEISSGQLASASDAQCNTCEQTRCDEKYPAYPDDYADQNAGSPQGTDRQFWNKPCAPYTFRNGVTSSYCYDEAAGETVAEPNEQCGDHWTKTVALTNEWRFYTVPFTQMTQQGWAKKFASMDQKSVSLVRFTWDGGWIDYYIDDVSFYRRRK